MKVKIIQNIGENIKAIEIVNKFPILGSLFTEEKRLCSFDWLMPKEQIVQIIREIFFQRIKSTLTIKEVFDGSKREFIVFQGSKIISSINYEYGRSENLQTLEEVENHIKAWFSNDLVIVFPETKI